MKLPPEFYTRKDVVQLAKKLLGKVLVSNVDGLYSSGIITETEAYAGVIDKASHAYGGKRTARTEIMFAEGGKSYVYLCYGIHSLFNVVSGPKDTPHAILVRGIHPLDGIEIMERRRNKKYHQKGFSSGPGTAAAALGIHYTSTGKSLQGEEIWIEDRGIKVHQKYIEVSARIGVEYAKEDALLPYRFVWKMPVDYPIEKFKTNADK